MSPTISEVDGPTAQTVLLYLSSSLSIFGCMLVFLDHFRSPKVWARPARRLLSWLCVADMGTALVYLFPTASGSTACAAQAAIGIYFPVASFMWTDCIALYVYWIVSSLRKRHALLRNSKRLFAAFHVTAWTVPAVAALSVLLTGHAGKNRHTETSGWCWIKTAEDDDFDGARTEMFLWEVVGGKGVEWFSVLVWCPLLYYRCWRHLSKQEETSRLWNDGALDRSAHSVASSVGSGDSESLASVDGSDGGVVSFTQFKRKLALVPVIFFLLRLPGSILTVWLYLEPDADIASGLGNVLRTAQVFCDPLQGFCNGVLFVACGAQAQHPQSEPVAAKERGRFAGVPHSGWDAGWNASPIHDDDPRHTDGQGDIGESYYDMAQDYSVGGGALRGGAMSSGRGSAAYRTDI